MISTKPIVFVILALALFATASTSLSQSKEKPADVGIVVTASRDTLAPGAVAELCFTFTPGKGFHVNAVPALSVKLDSAAPASVTGNIVIPADTATGYLESSLPVRQPITLGKTAAPGRAELKGVLTYYYCSDAEGWCRKETLPFTLPVTVQ